MARYIDADLLKYKLSVNLAQLIDDMPTIDICEDYISRQLALNKIYENFDGVQCYDGTGFDIYSECKDELEKLPFVQPSRPKGMWAWRGQGHESYAFCEACGKVPDEPSNGWENVSDGEGLISIYKYCPNCGADMREKTLKQAGQSADNDTLMPAT